MRTRSGTVLGDITNVEKHAPSAGKRKVEQEHTTVKRARESSGVTASTAPVHEVPNFAESRFDSSTRPFAKDMGIREVEEKHRIARYIRRGSRFVIFSTLVHHFLLSYHNIPSGAGELTLLWQGLAEGISHIASGSRNSLMLFFFQTR